MRAIEDMSPESGAETDEIGHLCRKKNEEQDKEGEVSKRYITRFQPWMKDRLFLDNILIVFKRSLALGRSISGFSL